MDAVHYDITIKRRSRWNNKLIWPADLTGWTVTFYKDDTVLYTTTNGTLKVTCNSPSAGESTIEPIFTTTQTQTMEKGTYYIMGLPTNLEEECFFEGAIIV